MIARESLPSAARTALENTNFGEYGVIEAAEILKTNVMIVGSANVPFKDANFNSNLGKALL